MKISILTIIFCAFFANTFAQNVVQKDYAIQRGDNVTSIARKFGMNVERLKELNPQVMFNLKVGESLQVEEAQNASQTVDNKAVTVNSDPNAGADHNVVKYKIRSGDNLNGVAKMYMVNVEDIKNANPEIMVNGAIKVGQTLIIPIGKNTPVNNANSGSMIGSTTVASESFEPKTTTVESTSMIGSTAVASESFEPKANNPVQYKVLGGDTLLNIAKKFNSTPEIIKELNQLTNDNVKIGQVLKVLPK
ncbi:MAG: LysM peptidoglycan-binding domain-containing protein [Bacteroidetes bacterium]|nr:MAG: LysM peptidoglycan-binding domain-containing protein [Bacteroidota bacterium]